MFAMIIIKVVSRGIAAFAFLCLLVLSCESSDQERRARERSIRQREQEKSTVRTTGTKEIYGRYKASEYSGPSCKNAEDDKKDIDGEDCEEVCDRLFDSESSKCEKLALELIETFAELFEDMSHVDNEENLSRSVSSFNFGVMIDIGVQPVKNLIENWNIRETKVFLIWVAKTSAVTLALENHDREHAILKSAFEKISDGTVEEGLATDLSGFGKTFWNLAREEKNKSGFIVLHDLLSDVCSDKNCKIKNYCIREEYADFRNRTVCPYTSDRRSFRRLTHCYIHGPNVWSYWLSLNREGEFDDKDFPPAEAKMNEQECDKFCEGSEKCRRN